MNTVHSLLENLSRLVEFTIDDVRQAAKGPFGQGYARIGYVGLGDPNVPIGTVLDKGFTPRRRMALFSATNWRVLEKAMELIRAEKFTEKPSRGKSSFVAPTEGSARHYGAHVYEVQIDGPVFEADACAVSDAYDMMFEGGRGEPGEDFEAKLKRGRAPIENYWKGWDCWGGTPNREWLVPGKAVIVRKVNHLNRRKRLDG